jgi:hypothetical protein
MFHGMPSLDSFATCITSVNISGLPTLSSVLTLLVLSMKTYDNFDRVG